MDLKSVKSRLKENRLVIVALAAGIVVGAAVTAIATHDPDDHWTSIAPNDEHDSLVISTQHGHKYEVPGWYTDPNLPIPYK